MKIIDTHVHVFADSIAERALTALHVPGHYEPKYNGTVTGLYEQMRRCGISHAWTLPVATKVTQVETINKLASAYDRSKLTPFGAIHPDSENPREILRGFKELGLVGFKMHPDYQSFHPTEERLQPILDAASDFGLIAYFHAGDDENPRTRFGQPKEFAAIIDEYPKLKLALAHLGGYRMFDDVEEYLAGKGEHVYLDTCYVFEHIEMSQFKRIAQKHGLDRIMFGSDGPWADPMVGIRAIQSVGYSDAELEGIFNRNAERLLAL